MAHDYGQGIFTMDVLRRVAERFQASLDVQKDIACRAINESTATDENKRKATAMVLKSTSHRALMLGMSNFSMSHQGLKVIR